MLKLEDLSKIGIGTWRLDVENFDQELESLKYAFQLGENYTSLSMLYNNGLNVKQMKRFLDSVPRDKIFIMVNLDPTINTRSDVETQLNLYLKELGIEYVDAIQLHSPRFTNISLEDLYEEIKRLVEIKKIRYVGISNVNLEQLKDICKIVKLDFFEGVYNLECKIYEDLGVLDYCAKNNIKFVAYQPLRRNRTALRNYDVLVNLAKKYQKTQNQIIINYLVNEKNIMPIIKSSNKDRIKENIEALNFEMTQDDYELLNNFRNKEFDNVQVVFGKEDGVSIDQLPNQFD